MNSVEQNNITEEEAELYDRQIRLWGANVQKALRNLKILVIGLKGVAAEISKNLILSGVKSITMMDPEKVVEGDINSQYFFYPEDVGQNRAQASLKAAQILNPNVVVRADMSSPLDKSISYYSNFDVICVTNQSPEVIICLNDICKLYKIKFFNGDSFGMFGYIFEDLNETEHVNPQEQVSFQTALNHKWTPNTSIKKRKYEDPSYLIFKILIDFYVIHDRKPSRNTYEHDSLTLTKLRKAILNKFNVEEDILPMEYLSNVYGEFGPTCSIIGAMIAQQVVKSLSDDFVSPHNLYFFNHLRCQLTGITVSGELISQKKEIIINSENVVELEV